MYTLICRREINGESAPLEFPSMSVYHSRTLKSVKDLLIEKHRDAEDRVNEHGYRITANDVYMNGLYANLEYEIGPSEYPYVVENFEIFKSKSLDNRKF